MAPTVVYKKRYFQFPPAGLLEHPAGGKTRFWGVAGACFSQGSRPLSLSLFGDKHLWSILDATSRRNGSRGRAKQTDIRAPAGNGSHGWHPQLCTKN
eukprot:gene16975-biopygen14367